MARASACTPTCVGGAREVLEDLAMVVMGGTSFQVVSDLVKFIEEAGSVIVCRGGEVASCVSVA